MSDRISIFSEDGVDFLREVVLPEVLEREKLREENKAKIILQNFEELKAKLVIHDIMTTTGNQEEFEFMWAYYFTMMPIFEEFWKKYGVDYGVGRN